MVPVAADDHLRRLDKRPGGRRQALEPVLADADDVQPGLAHASPAASALTAAAAMALPPRRPRTVTKGMPWGSEASRAFDSAAPTKPTGKPRISAGLGAPCLDPLHQTEEGGRRIADRDDGACQPLVPEIDLGGAAGGSPCAGHVGHARIAEQADHLVAGRKTLGDDPVPHHFGIAEDGATVAATRRNPPPPHPAKRRCRRPDRPCRRHESI